MNLPVNGTDVCKFVFVLEMDTLSTYFKPIIIIIINVYYCSVVQPKKNFEST